MSSPVLQRWHEIVRTRDMAGLHELLAPDVVFHSPVVHTPQAGRAITEKYLMAAMHVLNNPSFTYLNEWSGPHSGVLEFQTVLNETIVNGVDIIDWNAGHQITRFKVMVRPLRAVNTLHEMMRKMLEAGGA